MALSARCAGFMAVDGRKLYLKKKDLMKSKPKSRKKATPKRSKRTGRFLKTKKGRGAR